MRFTRLAAAALAIGVAATAFTTSADAGHRYRNRDHGAFFGGFAAGALLGALVQPHYGRGYYRYDYAPRYYYRQPPVYYYQPAPPVYYRPPPVYYRPAPGYYGPGYFDPCSIPGGAVSRPANAMC